MSSEGNTFEAKMFEKIRQSAYMIYHKEEGTELTVDNIFDELNKNTFGKSGMNMKELCERGGMPEEEIRKAILEGIKAPSIDSLA